MLFKLFGFIPVSLLSVFDVGIVSLIIYRTFVLIKGTRAGPMLVGLLLLVLVAMAAPWLQMNALAWLLEQLRSILLILLVVLFQSELRRVLMVLGQSPLLTWFYKPEPPKFIDTVVSGAVQLSEQGYGALIVLLRQGSLGTILETGGQLHAKLSDDLLTTIFSPRTPLHDQAVILQGELLLAARCTLPLAEDVEDDSLGTRHRAAFGLSQESDAVIIVISEETRAISLAVGGELMQGIERDELKARLFELLAPKQ